MPQQPSEITYIVAYRCPNCQAALEARTSEAQTWLRCPKCGRANLPPELVRTPRVDPILPGDDVLVIGPATDAPGLDTGEQGGYHRTYPGAVRRVALAILLLSSVSSVATAFLTGNFMKVAIFGVITIFLLVITSLTARRR
ncbi:hypothetical protein SAMN05444166_4790 [Singulisphaera sp. GP187]|uniref:transposase n=1 Tax=Singulisphaera sp. GP187 TaxID=1882752 RepID=UPI00092638E2|nr:transposase [Singulisphaera sp. GP187]SIO44593.1 hypothetical protein SAMN05444166_4790 [Singulisphaera sp. GP187]